MHFEVLGIVSCGRLQEGNGHGKKLARWEVMAMAKSLRWEVMAMGWQRHLCSGIIALPHHRQPLATPYTADRPTVRRGLSNDEEDDSDDAHGDDDGHGDGGHEHKPTNRLWCFGLVVRSTCCMQIQLLASKVSFRGNILAP